MPYKGLSCLWILLKKYSLPTERKGVESNSSMHSLKFAQAALKANALDTKTKELIALAIAVATRCDGCIAFHAEAAVKQGASREEVLETMGMAIYMGAGPSVMYAAQALEAFDQFQDTKTSA